MAISAIQAAKYLCEESDWTLTNLKLQKILYIAHVVYMGRNGGNSLIREKFEAWDYGPVVPELYHIVKIFGSGQIKNVFRGYNGIQDGTEKSVLKEAFDNLAPLSPGQLVNATHKPTGAWKKAYLVGRSMPISDSAIMEEYRELATAHV